MNANPSEPAGNANESNKRAEGVQVFKVTGVVKDDGRDGQIFIEALSEANARVKAELRGIIVTSIEVVESSRMNEFMLILPYPNHRDRRQIRAQTLLALVRQKVSAHQARGDSNSPAHASLSAGFYLRSGCCQHPLGGLCLDTGETRLWTRC